jgi:hypothetical protein
MHKILRKIINARISNLLKIIQIGKDGRVRIRYAKENLKQSRIFALSPESEDPARRSFNIKF